MERFKWDDQYSIGNSSIDEQHKKLISLANLVLSFSDAGEKPEIVKRAVVTLCDYTRTHFTEEEKYMEIIRYAGLEEHRLLHSNIVGEMNRIMKGSKTIRDLVEQFKRLMPIWVIQHIMTEDKKIGPP